MLTIFTKYSILDAWQDSEYTSAHSFQISSHAAAKLFEQLIYTEAAV